MNMNIMAVDAVHLKEVSESRRSQMPVRVGLTIFFFLIYGPVLGWVPTTTWMLVYLMLQGLELVLDRGADFERSRIALPLLTLQGVVFGSLSLWEPSDRAGWALGILLVMGGLLNAVVTSRRSLAAFLANNAPYAFYLQAWPIRGFLAGDSFGELLALTTSTILAVVYSFFLWRSSAASIIAAAESYAEAQASASAKTDFLANMSHELRTPLNGVVATASVLARTDLTLSQVDMVQVIQTSAFSLQTLLSDVLDLSKIEAGRIDLQSETTSPAIIARHVATLFSTPAGEKGLSFSLDLDEGAEQTILADIVRLTQILTNLCSNAVKFTDAGGVTLVLRCTIDESRCHADFSVTDTGIGMSLAAQTKIFERFSQADGSITRRFGGTGLGLSISRQLTELMGGQIRLNSTEGAGSTFVVSIAFPLAQVLAPSQKLAVRERDAPYGDPYVMDQGSRRLRVLVVEDHPVNRQVIQMMLGEVVDLHMAHDGLQGFAAATEMQYDIILMDMQMPLMDGLSATRAIRDREAKTGARRTPIIMLTANAMPEHLSLAHAAGADDYLTKPITAEALFTSMDILLGADETAQSDAYAA